METKQNFNQFGIILGISLVFTGAIGSYAFYKSHQVDTLSVTGSAKQRITSDTVKWIGAFNRIVPVENLKDGYTKMKKDEGIIVDFLKSNGIQEADMKISPVFLDSQFQYNPQAPREYFLRQTLEINSSDVAKITDLAKNFQPIVDAGVTFSTQSLEYYYSKLPELRISMLSEAVKDAQSRADSIAGATGKKAGSVRSASSGVVQVLPVNSTEVSDYGNYDTSSIEKEVMVTVKASFSLK